MQRKYIIAIVSVASVLSAALMFCFVSSIIRRRRAKKQQRILEQQHQLQLNSIPSTSSNVYSVQNVSGIGTFPNAPVNHATYLEEREMFAVPHHLLPNSFDYGSTEVKNMGDYVLVKDLNLLQPITDEELGHRDEYKKQQPYNPNF